MSTDRIFLLILMSICSILANFSYQPHQLHAEPSKEGAFEGAHSPIRAQSPQQDQCDLESFDQSNNDIIILPESTQAVGDKGMATFNSKIIEMLSPFNLCLSNDNNIANCTRLGIIQFADTIKILNPLGSIDNDTLQGLSLSLLPINTSYVDFGGVIQQANRQFNNISLHRLNSRKVIILMGTSVNEHSDYGQSLAYFKESGGKLIVYEYMQKNSVGNPVFKSVASDGYYLSNQVDAQQNDVDLLRKAILRANCYCNNGWDTFHYQSDPRDADFDYANGGCFSAQVTQMPFERAQAVCASSYNSSVLSLMGGNQTKMDFITGYMNQINRDMIWLNARKIGDDWYWDGVEDDDHKIVSGDLCHLGLSTAKIYNEDDINCATLKIDGNGMPNCVPSSCAVYVSSVCEAPPIDASNFHKDPYLPDQTFS